MEGRELMGLIACTIPELFDGAVRRFAQKPAVIYKEDTYTWRDLDVLSNMMAKRFADKGIARGERVGLWSENSATWIVTFVALQKLGAVPVLLNSNYKERELVQVMRISDLCWLCYGNTPGLKMDERLPQRAASQVGAGMQGLVDIREETLELRSMLGQGEGKRERILGEQNCHDLACMLFSSGTTIRPKCVQHTHYSLVNNAIATAERANMTSDDRICMSQPLFHVFALCASLLTSFYCGLTLCLLSRFSSENILYWIERHRCTILNGVPTNFLCMMSSEAFHHFKTDSLRLLTIGGDTISESQYECIREAFPAAHILRNYGLTEGCNLCNSEYSDSPRTVSRCVGRPYPNIEVKIWEAGEQRFLPAGKQGEIVARGYNLMQGYFPRLGEQPVSAIDSDGWLHTGDLGVMDEEGRVSVVGRIKDIIIRGGENITPVEISREIMRYEPVLSARVVGVPHPILGEEVIACLMLDEPESYCEEELRSMLKVRLAKYKIPVFFLVYEAFPLMPNGKVDMRALREDAWAKAREQHKEDERYHVLRK